MRIYPPLTLNLNYAYFYILIWEVLAKYEIGRSKRVTIITNIYFLWSIVAYKKIFTNKTNISFSEQQNRV